MAYIVPKVLIKQEFSQLPVFADAPLSALVFGPQYELHRYTVASEKASTAVVHPDTPALTNKYQAEDEVTYNFPNQTAGTYVDADFVKVNIANALVEYYPVTDLGSTGGTITRVQHPIFTSSYFLNRFTADDLVFKTANSLDRSADFSNRDVSPGDYVVLKNIDTSAETTVRVKGLHATKTAATLSDEAEDADNFNNQSEDYNNAPTYVNPGSNATVDVAPSNTSSAYKGYAALGVMSDTYTIEVTTPGALNEALFTITSEAGVFATKTDQALDVNDALIIDNAGSNVVKIDFTAIERASGALLQLGDVWTLSVVAPVAVTTPDSSGTYTGTEDLIYKLKVVRGGPFYSGSNADVCCKIAVTSDGSDASSAVNVAVDTDFRVGSHGARATFTAATNNGGLILGDAYYITATAAADSYTNILEVYETLPATFLDDSEAYEIISMRFPTDIEVPAINPADEDIVNWEVDDSAQTITVYPGITTSNSSIAYSGGDLLSLNVVSGDLFVTHRDLVITNTISIGSVTAEDEVEALLGTIHPDNPLAQGVYDAALNANGAPTYFCGVQTNDLSGYEQVLALARREKYYYGLVPLTFDRTVQDAVVAHMNAMSTPENAKWRCVWLSTPITETSLIYDKQEDNTNWKATISDDPFATGTQYRLVTIEGATFFTDGVRATDKLLINFSVTPSGKTVYDSYTIAEVRTEDTLVLAAGPSSAINVAQKAQIQRVYTKDEQIDALSHVGGDYDNRRVRMIFPPVTKNGAIEKDGYFLAAAMAGLRAGVVPHQGLTNTTLLGFTDLTMSVNTFSDIQLNRLAEQGFWIATQQVVGATPYVRHQLTTDTTNLNYSEDSITTNVDSISFGLYNAIEPYIGKWNIHRGALVNIRRSIVGELTYRLTNTYTQRAGNQLNSFEIVRMEQDPTFKDRLIVDIKIEVPYPLNFIVLTLFV